MSNRNISILVATTCIGVLILGFASIVIWLNNRPRWELTAQNTSDGLRIEVFKQNDANSTYTTVLGGHQISRSFDRVTIGELPPEIGETTFTDETLKPGRWTLILDGVKIDIMPARLIIDGETELAPSDSHS